MSFHMFTLIPALREPFVTNFTLVRALPSVDSKVLDQLVLKMELFAALGAFVLAVVRMTRNIVSF